MSGMYQLLARDCNEVLATFAYAAYKQHKAEVLQTILAETGKPATPEDLELFQLAASTPSMRAMYMQWAEFMLQSFIEQTLELRKHEVESEFITTKISEQLQAIQDGQQQKRSWKGWTVDVCGNLAVNFVTILVIAALLFGFRGLDGMLADFGHHTGGLDTRHAAPK